MVTMLRILFLATTVIAWSSAPTTIDLTCPPTQYERDTVVDGRVIVPDSVMQQTAPCSDIEIPTSVERTQFPLVGGVLDFAISNTSSPESIGTYFIVNAYLSQFSNDRDPTGSSWSYIGDYIYRNASSRETLQDDTANITRQIGENPGFHLQLDGLTSQDLNNVNATLGLRMILFTNAGSTTLAETLQCSYLTLVNRNISTDFAGPSCASRPSSAPSASSPTSPTTSGSTSIPTGPGPSPSGTNSNSTMLPPPARHHASTIGIAVGVSVGSALILILLGMFFLWRRRDGRGRPTVALDFFVHGREPAIDGAVTEKADVKASTKMSKKFGEKVKGWRAKRDEKKGEERGDAETDSTQDGGSTHGSTHSEPLPVYRKEEKRNANQTSNVNP